MNTKKQPEPLTELETTLFHNHLTNFKAVRNQSINVDQINLEEEASNECSNFVDLLNRITEFGDRKTDTILFNLELLNMAFLEKNDKDSLIDVTRSYHEILSLLTAIWQNRELIIKKRSEYSALLDIYSKRELIKQ